MVLDSAAGQGAVVGQAGSAPDAAWLSAFIDGSGHLATNEGGGDGGPGDLLRVPMAVSGLTVAVGREARAFHERERARLRVLARTIDKLLASTPPCPRPDPARPRPIWSLCVSNGDLVTVVLDIEKESDQIGSGRPRNGSSQPISRTWVTRLALATIRAQVRRALAASGRGVGALGGFHLGTAGGGRRRAGRRAGGRRAGARRAHLGQRLALVAELGHHRTETHVERQRSTTPAIRPAGLRPRSNTSAIAIMIAA